MLLEKGEQLGRRSVIGHRAGALLLCCLKDLRAALTELPQTAHGTSAAALMPVMLAAQPRTLSQALPCMPLWAAYTSAKAGAGLTWNRAWPRPWRWCCGSTKKSSTHSGWRLQYAAPASRRNRLLRPVFSKPTRRTLQCKTAHLCHLHTPGSAPLCTLWLLFPPAPGARQSIARRQHAVQRVVRSLESDVGTSNGCLASASLVSHKFRICGIFTEWAITRMHHLGTP